MAQYFEYIVSGKGSDISVHFPTPIIIDSDRYDAKIGLKSFVTYNNIANVIDKVNNGIKILTPEYDDYITCRIETGSYEIEQISAAIQRFIKEKRPKLKKVEEAIRIEGNESTSKAEIVIERDGYGVDFDCQGSICKILGFEQRDKFQSVGRHIAGKIVDIISVTHLVVNTNVVESNYINEQLAPYLYACSLDSPPGYRIQREISNICYKKLISSQISFLRCWLTDQHSSIVDIRGDELLIVLSIKLTPKKLNERR